VDVNLENLSLDLYQAQETINSSEIPIKAIFPIHPLGYAIDHEEFQEFCEKNDLISIHDVCESLGSWRKGVHAGTSGLAGSFSFYFSHHITTMEGGGIATNSDEFADDLRAIRSHGWSRDRTDATEWTNQVSRTDAKFLFVTTGYNIRPMEIQAAIGRLQIADIDQFITRRREIARTIAQAIEGRSVEIVDGGLFEIPTLEEAHSWMLIPLKVKGDDRVQRKKRILEFLEECEIETRPVLTGNFLSQPSMNRIDGNHPAASNFPNATEVTDSYFMVGAHHDLSEAQVAHLANSLVYAADNIY
jgi:CDP-6-deoxy-D-xylo-4-hexulose-3-dehydrase